VLFHLLHRIFSRGDRFSLSQENRLLLTELGILTLIILSNAPAEKTYGKFDPELDFRIRVNVYMSR
jgi:hypothetical protein